MDVEDNGSSTTTLFTYAGNRIERIDEVDKSTSFTYVNNLITEAIILNKITWTQNTLKYSYENDQLVQIVSSENYVINYSYKSDETVSYEKIQKDSGNNVVSHLRGVLYFQNNNLMKDERTFSDPNSNVQIVESENFEYDAKINPMHNVLGFGKLLHYSKHVSPNNSKSFWESSEVHYVTEDQLTSSATGFRSIYKYDSDGYPTEVDSERPFLGNGNSENAKTFLNYK